MRRPQSAKPGHRANWGQGSQSDLQDYDGASRGAYRKNVKLMKPDLTTNDFARILPKKIYQDKQRLYSQALQLKQNLNQTIEQNIRLKTRITILQKQKDKLTKHIQNNNRQPQNTKQSNSRVNIYPGKSGEKENMMIRNLKKLVREGKEQNEFLKQQNAKIKKAIKYTKINELQIQRKMLQDQNKRVVTLLEQLNGQLADQDHAERELHDLRRALQDQQDANRQLNDANLKYMEYIQELEDKVSQQAQKAQNKENKIQRQLALTKRKLNQASKFVQDLKKQLNTLKIQNLNTKSQTGTIKPQSIVTKPDSQRPKLARPVSSNPYKSQGMVGVRLATQSKKEEENKENEKMKNMQLENEQLKEELSRAKIRLQQTEREVRKQSEQRTQNNEAHKQQNNQVHTNQAHNNQAHKQHNKQNKQTSLKPMAENTNNKNNTQQQKPSVKNIQNKQKEQYYDDNQQQQNYENQFQPSQHDQSSTVSPQKNKPKEAKQLDQYKKDFQAEEEEQPLYVKEDEPPKKKKNSIQQSKKNTQGLKKQSQKDKNQKQLQKDKKKKDKKLPTASKPDKSILKQIKQLLTYRMKAQRYPYQQLKRDIQQAKQKAFSLTDLKGMFINEPFYLTQTYADNLVHYCFQNYNPAPSQTVSSEVLLTKLRKLIDQFELIDQKEEEDMLLRVAEMVTEYPEELETAFEKIKNGEQTVAKDDLIEMFQNLELEHKYIELIIQQLSLCSTDIQHLNFVGFFQRFYVDNMSGLQNGQIDEQQMQSSSEQVSRNLKAKDTKKFQQVKAEFQDNDDDLMVDDGEKISLGNNDHYNDANIVSDDQPI